MLPGFRYLQSDNVKGGCMEKYPKITTVFERDPSTNFRTVIEGQFSKPEFRYLQHADWYFTEKLDGTNIRVLYSGGNITFRGRTDNSVLPGFIVSALGSTFLPLGSTLLEVFSGNGCLYGEMIGNKIQSGGSRYNESGVEFVLFDVKLFRDNGISYWLNRPAVEYVANRLGISLVPVVGEGDLWDMVDMVKSGFESIYGNFTAEGVVAKPRLQLFDREGNRVITKLKCNDF